MEVMLWGCSNETPKQLQRASRHQLPGQPLVWACFLQGGGSHIHSLQQNPLRRPGTKCSKKLWGLSLGFSPGQSTNMPNTSMEKQPECSACSQTMGTTAHFPGRDGAQSCPLAWCSPLHGHQAISVAFHNPRATTGQSILPGVTPQYIVRSPLGEGPILTPLQPQSPALLSTAGFHGQKHPRFPSPSAQLPRVNQESTKAAETTLEPHSPVARLSFSAIISTSCTTPITCKSLLSRAGTMSALTPSAAQKRSGEPLTRGSHASSRAATTVAVPALCRVPGEPSKSH